MDKTKIEQLKQERESELKSLIAEHDAWQVEEQKRAAQVQQRVMKTQGRLTHLEGMIAGYQTLLDMYAETPPA